MPTDESAILPGDLSSGNMQSMSFYTYILECADGRFYTGWTVDLPKRLEAHNSGRGARFTRGRGPVRLAASWNFDTKSDAMKFEWQVKQLSRSEKCRLISEYLNTNGAFQGED